MKRLISLLLGASIIVSSSAYAMSGAVCELEAYLNVLNDVSTATTKNWKTSGEGKAALIAKNGAMRVVGGSNSSYSADMLAGGDLFTKTAPIHFMYWDFENTSDIFKIENENGHIKDLSLLPEGKWMTFYTQNSYWTSPNITELNNVQYINTDTGNEYLGIRTPSAPGSNKCACAPISSNDWNRTSLGMRIKLPEDKVIPGKTYVLKYYVMDNSAERDLYASFTKPTQSEPYPSGGGDEWYLSNQEPIGKIKRCWTEGSVEITPSEDAYEKGYTMLWLGMRGTRCDRGERIYFDSINLVAKDELVEKELTFTARIKGVGNNQDVTIAAMLQDECISSETFTAAGDWTPVEITIPIDIDCGFYLSEERGSPTSADRFKISFISQGKDQFYIQDPVLKCRTVPEYFADVADVAGSGMCLNVKVFSPDATDAWIVLSAYSDWEEEIIDERDIYLEEGVNEIYLDGIIPNNVDADAVLVVYVKDTDGNIISERRQSVSYMFKNGANIASASAGVYAGLQIFGSGNYIIEFETTAEDDSVAEVSLGELKAEAEIKDGVGMCEISISESDLGVLPEDASILVNGADINNITMKKVLDI